jgi:hypothetical protein
MSSMHLKAMKTPRRLLVLSLAMAVGCGGGGHGTDRVTARLADPPP